MRIRGNPETRTLEVAEKIYGILEKLGVEAAVIGAMALAVHRYVRFTRDFDLAIHKDPFLVLHEIQREVKKAVPGIQTDIRLPDQDDPLGGVLEITGKGFKPVQVVNFLNPLSPKGTSLGQEAIHEARPGLIENSRMRVVKLPHLIALKLYSGGAKSRNDVVELLERNQPLDLGAIRDVCTRHGLSKELEAILEELRL